MVFVASLLGLLAGYFYLWSFHVQTSTGELETLKLVVEDVRGWAISHPRLAGVLFGIEATLFVKTAGLFILQLLFMLGKIVLAILVKLVLLVVGLVWNGLWVLLSLVAFVAFIAFLFRGYYYLCDKGRLPFGWASYRGKVEDLQDDLWKWLDTLLSLDQVPLETRVEDMIRETGLTRDEIKALFLEIHAGRKICFHCHSLVYLEGFCPDCGQDMRHALYWKCLQCPPDIPLYVNQLRCPKCGKERPTSVSVWRKRGGP